MFISKPIESYAAVLQGGGGMEDALPSECVAIVRRDDDGKTIRDGIKVDEEWKHHPVSKVCGCGSIETCMSFVFALPFTYH